MQLLIRGNTIRKDHFFLLNKLLFELSDSQVPEAVSLFVQILDSQNHLVTTLREAIVHEVTSTKQPETLFRSSNSIAVKLINSYASLTEYLRSFGPVLSNLSEELNNQSSYEINPDRIIEGEDLSQNLESLKQASTALIDFTLETVDTIPVSLKVISRMLYEEVKAVYPSFAQVAVSGFFFLRFLCPALSVQPSRKGIISKELETPKVSRGLMLLGKILQLLSNGTQFTEEYMQPMNLVLAEYREAMAQFLENIITVPDGVELPHVSPEDRLVAYYPKLFQLLITVPNIKNLKKVEKNEEPLRLLQTALCIVDQNYEKIFDPPSTVPTPPPSPQKKSKDRNSIFNGLRRVKSMGDRRSGKKSSLQLRPSKSSQDNASSGETSPSTSPSVSPSPIASLSHPKAVRSATQPALPVICTNSENTSFPHGSLANSTPSPAKTRSATSPLLTVAKSPAVASTITTDSTNARHRPITTTSGIDHAPSLAGAPTSLEYSQPQPKPAFCRAQETNHVEQTPATHSRTPDAPQRQPKPVYFRSNATSTAQDTNHVEPPTSPQSRLHLSSPSTANSWNEIKCSSPRPTSATPKIARPRTLGRKGFGDDEEEEGTSLINLDQDDSKT